MLRHKATFESWLPALFDGEFKWDFLKPCFKGTKIEPMDFDAVVERRGKFLIFETKKPGKSTPLGQQITLTQAWNLPATVMQISGKTPEEIDGMAIYSETENPKVGNVGDKKMTPCDAFDVVFRVRQWFCWASGLEIPSKIEWENELWKWDYEGRT